MKLQTQDIDIATNVRRVLAARDLGNSKKSIYVTALSAAKGLLWVGTNVGIALTIPLPRLEGVPIISGKANISYHAHFGPVRMFLPLQPKVKLMGFLKMTQTETSGACNRGDSTGTRSTTCGDTGPSLDHPGGGARTKTHLHQTGVKPLRSLCSIAVFYLAVSLYQIQFQISDGHLVAPPMQTSLTKQYSSPMLGQRRF